MTLEITCRDCTQRFDVERRDLLRGPVTRCPACRDAADTPRVPATAVWSERSRVWCLTVLDCPYCHRKHHHGGNDGEQPDLGARVSHCITGAGGTYILVPAGEEESAA